MRNEGCGRRLGAARTCQHAIAQLSEIEGTGAGRLIMLPVVPRAALGSIILSAALWPALDRPLASVGLWRLWAAAALPIRAPAAVRGGILTPPAVRGLALGLEADAGRTLPLLIAEQLFAFGTVFLEGSI